MNFRQQLKGAYKAGYESALYEQGIPGRATGAPDLLTPLKNFFRRQRIRYTRPTRVDVTAERFAERSREITDSLIPWNYEALLRRHEENPNESPHPDTIRNYAMPNLLGDASPEGQEQKRAMVRFDEWNDNYWKQRRAHEENPDQVPDPGDFEDAANRFYDNDPYWNGSYLDDYGRYIGPGSDLGIV